MNRISITHLPDDLWDRADQLVHYAPVIRGREAQTEARRAVYRELQRGSISGLQDALTGFCAAYQRDINKKLIPLAKNALIREASQLRDDIDHWLEGREMKRTA